MRFVAEVLLIGGLLAPGAMWAAGDEVQECKGAKVAPSACPAARHEAAEIQASLDAYKIEQTLENYTKDRQKKPWLHLVDNLQFKAEGSYSNSDNLLTGPGYTTSVPREFDSERWFGNVSFGMVDRKAIRDLVLALDPQLREEYVRKKSKSARSLRWLIFDAVTINWAVGYGTTVEDAEGTENSKTSNQFLFTAGAKYTLPFDAGKWKNPLDR